MKKQRRARTTMIVLLILAASITAAVLWWKKNGRDTVASVQPEILFSAIDIKGISKDTIDMIAHVTVVNKLPVSFSAGSLDYNIAIDGKHVVKGNLNRKLSVAKNDTTALQIPMSINSDQLKLMFDNFEKTNADSASYQISASFNLDVPVAGKERFEVNREFVLPAVRLVSMKPAKFRIDKFSLKNPEATMDIIMENPNDFPFKMKDAFYKMKIGNEIHVDGGIAGLTTIPANASATIPVKVDIEKMNLPKAIWKTLFDKKDTPFDIWFESKLVSKNDMVNNSTMAFHADGTLADLAEAVKK
jgi:LEA14-like dessication related protein